MSENTGKTFNTIDASKLMETKLPPIRYIVDGFMPQGLHVLAGAPKVGKSYLTLWLCSRVALGEPLWDMETHRCDVLYISLEDTPERIRSRLAQMNTAFPDNLHLAVQAETLDEGLIEELENFLKEHPDVGLVAIDTLQKVRSQVSSGQGNPYAADYNALSALKAVADKHKVALLLVHHLRKARSDDPFQMISGTTGITGAVDTSYVLAADTKDRKSAHLYVNGRDIPYEEFDLCFLSGIWNLVERRTQTQMDDDDGIPELIQSVIELVYKNDGWKGTASQLTFLLQIKKLPVNMITHHIKDGAAFLEEYGVSVRFSRTGKNRFIHFDLDHDKKEQHLEEEKEKAAQLKEAAEKGYALSKEEMKFAGIFSSLGSKIMPFRRLTELRLIESGTENSARSRTEDDGNATPHDSDDGSDG